jgi:hypothetical protein
MALGIGRNTIAPLQHGPYYINVATDPRYASAIAAAVGNPGADVVPTIQQAIDDLSAQMGTLSVPSMSQGTILCPAQAAGSYYFGSTLEFDANCITLAGEGQGTVFQAITGGTKRAIQMIRVGFGRSGTSGGHNLAVTSAYRPTLSGVLDGSFNGNGFRTNGVASLSFEAGSPLTLGQNSSIYGGGGAGYCDNWNETNQFTLEFAIENYNNGGDLQPGTPIFTCGDPTNGGPLVTFMTMSCDNVNRLTLYVATRSTQFGASTQTILANMIVPSATLRRITVQPDLIGGRLLVFHNGLCVGVASLPTGGHFAANDGNPFLWFDRGVSGVQWGNPSALDYGLFGMSARCGIAYNTVSLGGAQTLLSSLGGGTPNDAQRYAPTSDPNLLCYLTMADSPTSGSRQLTVAGGAKAVGLTTQATICHALMTTIAPQFGAYCTIRDLKIVGNGNYGANICLGGPLFFKALRVSSQNAAYGIGGIAFQSNYNQVYNDCILSGSESAFWSFNQTAFIPRMQISNPGRVGIRLVGAGTKIDQINFASIQANTEYLLANDAGGFGGLLTCNWMVVDNESTIPLKAFVRLQPCANAFLNTFSFDQFSISKQGPLPIFEHDGLGAGQTALTLTNIQNADPAATGPVVSTDTDRLQGYLENFQVVNATRFVQRTAGLRTQFEVREKFPSIPRSGDWTPETIGTRPYAAPGQHGGFRCLAPGTGDLAVWGGTGPLLNRPTDLAADFRIGSSFLGTGTAFYVGLLKDGVELSGSGYARVLVANSGGQVATNVDGSKMLVGPLVASPLMTMVVVLFGTLSGPLSANQVGIYTGAGPGGSPSQGPVYIPGCEGGAPRVFTSGMAPSLAPGALVCY